MATHENIIIYHRKLIFVSHPTSIILHLFKFHVTRRHIFSNTAVILFLFHLFFSLIYKTTLSNTIVKGNFTGGEKETATMRREFLVEKTARNIHQKYRNEKRISVAWKKDRAKRGDWICVSEVRSDLVTICSAILTRSNL